MSDSTNHVKILESEIITATQIVTNCLYIVKHVIQIPLKIQSADPLLSPVKYLN